MISTLNMSEKEWNFDIIKNNQWRSWDLWLVASCMSSPIINTIFAAALKISSYFATNGVVPALSVLTWASYSYSVIDKNIFLYWRVILGPRISIRLKGKIVCDQTVLLQYQIFYDTLAEAGMSRRHLLQWVRKKRPVWRYPGPVGQDCHPCRWPGGAEDCIAEPDGRRWLDGRRCCWDIAASTHVLDDNVQTTARSCHVSVAMSTKPASAARAASHQCVNWYAACDFLFTFSSTMRY